MTACGVGFVHSAFAFGQESFIAAKFVHGASPSVHTTTVSHGGGGGGGSVAMSSADSKAAAVPPGMLISLLQRGLHYAAIEFHLNDDGTEKECTRPYSLLEPHVCERSSTAAGSSSHPMPGYHPTSTRSSAKPATFKPDIGKGDPTKSETMSKSEPGALLTTLSAAVTSKKKERENGAAPSTKKRKKGGEDPPSTLSMSASADQGEQPPQPQPPQQQQHKKKKSPKKNGAAKKGTAASSSASEELSSFARVSILAGHESEVITCAWNPAKDISLLASASGDGTSRLWTVPADGPWDADDAKMTVRILDHRQSRDGSDSLPAQSATEEEFSQDVTTMDWSPDGQVLATGCYDGRARLWSLDGDLLAVLSQHRGPIFQLHWSPTGRLLATAGLEPSVAVWDVSGRALLRSYAHHAAPALDVDWRDDETFATCATDRLIHIYKVDQSEPTLILSGHQDEVNSIKWSADGQLLLSSSDDHTARIWRISADARQGEPLVTLADHAQEIYTAKWGNVKTGSSASGPTSTLSSSLLATASFDGTVRLWSLSLTGPSATAQCVHVLRKHTQPVYAIDFSPCGNYLASGSLDGALIVWSLEEGRPLRTYQGKGGIFEVTWSRATGSESSITPSSSSSSGGVSAGPPAAATADHHPPQHRSHRLAACTSERELIVLDTGTNNLLL